MEDRRGISRMNGAIEAFRGKSDFLLFKRELEESTSWIRISAPIGYSFFGLTTYWYRNQHTGKVWRLVEPDPPFRGLWEEQDPNTNMTPNRG
jgi:hypothetical protein